MSLPGCLFVCYLILLLVCFLFNQIKVDQVLTHKEMYRLIYILNR